MSHDEKTKIWSFESIDTGYGSMSLFSLYYTTATGIWANNTAQRLYT